MPTYIRNTGYRFLLLAVFSVLVTIAKAQLVLTNATPSATIDFSNSMQTTVGSNPSTAFTGAGFEPTPTTAGRLNSNAWAAEGWSNGDLTYGGTQITAATDYTRGSTAAAVTTGGFYAYTGAPASVANPTLMIQAGGSDFDPGTLTLRVFNNGSTIITQLAVSYNIYVRNDQTRADSLNFSHSSDYFNNNDVPVPALDYGSGAATDAFGWVIVGSAPSRSTTITGLNITPGSYYYLRWSHKSSGSGSRDEIGLDDINVTATFSSPCSQPTTQATITSFSTVLSTQMDVNFTRGNGTGGVLIIASTSATLSANPISGNTYSASTNYGNGDPIGGGFVVYNGVANGVGAAATTTVTGLGPSTTYYFYIFEYDVTVPCYKTPSNTGNQGTAAGSATSPTDYFRSNPTGGAPYYWSNSSNWQSSPDNITWISATLKPTSSSKGITIQAGHTITLNTNETAKLLTVAASATLTYTNSAGGGWDLDIVADPSGEDFKIYGTYVLFGKMPTLASGATVRIYNGGLVRVDNNVIGLTSDDFARLATVYFENGAVYQWNTTTAFQTSSATYFPAASATDIATFRISQNIASIGANSTTTINGLLEVNGNVTTVNTGTKFFRNGIIGTATLTQNSTGPYVIDGSTASLGGTGAITLFVGGGLNIASSSVTTLISNKTINTAGATFSVDGTLYCGTNILSGTSIFSLSAAGTLGMGSPQGITTLASGAIGNIQVTGGRSYNTAGNYIYNSSAANQVTGNGLPATVTGFLTISNTAGAGNNTVTLTTNNTTVTTFNLAAGLFEAGTSQFLKIAATGTVNGSGGNQGQSAAAGTIWFVTDGTINPGTSLALTNVLINGGVIMGGANTTINGTFTIGSGGYVNGGTAPTYSSSPASTLLYSCGCNYGASNEWYANTYGTSAGVPHHVTLAAGTSLNFGSTTFPHEMRGDMTINNGSTLALSTGFGGDLYIKGNWTRTASGSFTSNVRAVKFNGTSGNQTVTRTGGGTEFFPYMIIAKATGQSVVLAAAPNATTINIDGFFGGNTLQITGGDLDLNQQTLNFASYVNSNQNNLGIDGTVGDLTRTVKSTGGTGTFAIYNSTGVTHNITISRMSANASLLVFASGVTVTTGAAGPGGGGINFGNTITTINGTLQLNSYGFVTGFAPTYGTGSYLVYNNGGTFDRNVEWGSLSGPGYPYNVTVQNNTYLQLNTPAINGDADRAIAGTLSIANGSTLLLSTTASNKLTVGANVQIDGTLTLPTVVGGDIYIGGNWNRSATGVFNPNDRAVFFNGSANATITASGGQLFPYIYLTKNALSNTLTLLDDISISKEFGVTSGTFELAAKNATLKSDAGNTASFGQVGATGDVSYSGVGRFIVERYLPTGIGGGQHGKSWQFLAVPDNGGQTINAGWQEGNVLPTVGTSGLGTIISNNLAGAGFDIIGGSGPSMKSWNASTGTWIGVPNTSGTALYNQKGYFLFVRGDRTVTAFNQTATTTTLRSTGKLFVPGSNPAPSTTVTAGTYESIGNPYASAIDFLNVTKTAGVDNVFYVWDPLLPGTYSLGGFQTISSANGYKPNPGGTANYSSASAYTKIQSGQAFMVHSTAGGGTVSFSESAKLAGSNMVYRQMNQQAQPSTTTPDAGNNNSGRQFLRVQLFTNDGKIADGNVVAFDQQFSSEYEANDALKIAHAGENFDISSNEKLLSVEARAKVGRTDTIRYSMNHLRQQPYQLRFGPENFNNNLLKAWLVDKFLHTHTPLSLTDSSYFDINITADPASFAADRFMVVFIRKRIHVSDPGIAGKTPIVANKKDIDQGSISVYPNPVVDKNIRIQFEGKPAGNYKLQLIDITGKQLLTKAIQLQNYLEMVSIKVPASASGTYKLRIISPSGTYTDQQLFIE